MCRENNGLVHYKRLGRILTPPPPSLDNDPIHGVDYLGLADYGKEDLSGQLGQAWSDGAAQYASFGAKVWAGWAVEQAAEFMVGLGVGLGKGSRAVGEGLVMLAKGKRWGQSHRF